MDPRLAFSANHKTGLFRAKGINLPKHLNKTEYAFCMIDLVFQVLTRYVHAVVPETKGMSLPEIHYELCRGRVETTLLTEKYKKGHGPKTISDSSN